MKHWFKDQHFRSLLKNSSYLGISKIVAALCDLAQWAPNHKRTWPWRFAAFSGSGRAKLGAAFAAGFAGIGNIIFRLISFLNNFFDEANLALD